MTGQDLYCLGRTSAGGADDVQEDVRDDAPVEIQGQAPEEDEEEAGDNVDVDKEETEGEKHGGDEKSSSTNDWICPWILCLQRCGQGHTQGDPNYPRHHHDHTEDEGDVLGVDAPVLLVHGVEPVRDVLGPPPRQGPSHEGDASERQSRKYKTLVLGQTDDILLKHNNL